MKIKLITVLAFFTLCFAVPSNAASYLDDSIKTFGVSADNMYLTSLSILNSLNYEILEMQSASGYILFRTGAKDYIMTITAASPVTSNIKILPANSIYSTGSTVQKTIFDALEANKLNILKKQG